MAVFLYTALDATGAYVKGRADASNVKKATAKLEKEGFLIVNLKREKIPRFEKLNYALARVTRVDKIFFTRHLYTLLESGVALDEALRITAEQNNNVKFKDTLNDLYKRVQEGQSFHSTLALHSKYFSNFYINLVKVGERTGKLDEVILHILEQQENDHELITKVRGAMIYPALIIAAAFAIVIFMMTFVVPKITGILSEYNVDLPVTTKILVAISNFLVHFGFVAIPATVILAVIGFRAWTHNAKGKKQWDSIKLTMPLIKKITMEFNLARISRAMSSLMKSGMPMDQALDLVATVTANTQYQQSLKASIALVQKGVALSEILHNYPKIYPPITVRMIETGERSGRLEHMFDRLANFYEKSVADTLKNLSTIIEPILLLFIGAIVGFLGLSILTPIWKFSETVK